MKNAARTAAILLLAAFSLACGREEHAIAAQLTGGDPDRGKKAIRQYGCYTCHTIPGIANANAVVGPPLDRMGVRVYIAGRLPNTPENMIRWIIDPRGVEAHTAMPDTGVTPADARDITAYLYTLR